MENSFYLREVLKLKVGSVALAAVIFCFVLIPAGCVSVTPQQQRLVSKPNMQFSGSLVFNYQDRLLSQFESSSASSIGGQSGSCGSCTSGGA